MMLDGQQFERMQWLVSHGWDKHLLWVGIDYGAGKLGKNKLKVVMATSGKLCQTKSITYAIQKQGSLGSKGSRVMQAC